MNRVQLIYDKINEAIADAVEDLKDPDNRGHLGSLARGYLEGLEKARELIDGTAIIPAGPEQKDEK